MPGDAREGRGTFACRTSPRRWGTHETLCLQDRSALFDMDHRTRLPVLAVSSFTVEDRWWQADCNSGWTGRVRVVAAHRVSSTQAFSQRAAEGTCSTSNADWGRLLNPDRRAQAEKHAFCHRAVRTHAHPPGGVAPTPASMPVGTGETVRLSTAPVVIHSRRLAAGQAQAPDLASNP